MRLISARPVGHDRLAISLVILVFALTAGILATIIAPPDAHAASNPLSGGPGGPGSTVGSVGNAGPPPGTVVHAAKCEQAPPQSVKDRATYTPAELDRFGLPPRTPGEPFDKWAKVVRGAGERVCDYTVGAERWTSEQNSFNWAGNFADESTGGQVYTEADLDYYVSCIGAVAPNGQSADYAAWVGLGGVYTGNLVQTGTAGFQKFNSINGWQNTYWTWVENLGNNSDPGAHYLFAVNCGDHMYVKAWDSGSTGCMYIMRIRDGKNSGNQCYGPKSDEQSGEAIVEQNYQYPNLARFGSETFYGVGITDHGGYYGVNNLPHDYSNMFECQPISNFPLCTRYGDQLAWTGPIQNDPGDVPYDQYAVNWSNYQ
jgi:hypothetical protein